MSQIELASPLNRNWSPNFGAASRWLVLPNRVTGQTLIDIAGRNNGTLTNGATFSTDRHLGGCGSVSFDGTNDYVDLGSPAALNLPGTFSFCCWYRNTSAKSFQAFIANSNSGGSFANYAVTFNYTANKFELWNNASGPQITSTASISDTAWHHYGCVRSGVAGSWNLSLYIDGVLDKTATSGIDPSGGTYPVALGRFGGFNGYYLLGNQDDAAIYPRALTAFEFSEIYKDSRANYQRTLNWRRSRAIPASGGGSPVTVIPGTRAVTITRFAPTVRTPRTVIPGARSVTITGHAPTVKTPRTVVPGTRTITVTRFAPTVTTSRIVVPSTRHVTITGHAPTVLTPRTVTPGTRHVTLTGHAPRVLIPSGSIVGAHVAATEVSYARAAAIGISFSRATATEVSYPRAEAIGISGE